MLPLLKVGITRLRMISVFSYSLVFIGGLDILTTKYEMLR